MQKRIAVLGGGAFGSAFSTLLLNNGHFVNLWCYEPDVVEEINTKKTNSQFLPGVSFDGDIKASEDLQVVLNNAEWVFLAVPVKFLRRIVEQAMSHVTPDHKWVILSKGIEKDSLMLPSQVLADVIRTDNVAALAGPNFAKELAEKKVAGADIAASSHVLLIELKELLDNNYFKVSVLQDILGIQSAAALKNVLAVASGIIMGAELGYNTRSLVITKGFAELRTVVELFGGKSDTIYGLAGLGDLILTSTGPLSRNLKLGEMIGAGKALNSIDVMAEGLNTIESVIQIAKENSVKLPVCEGVYKVLFEGLSVSKFIDDALG